jgi:ADP-ribosylation factor-like protein 5B
MGAAFSSLWSYWFRGKECKIVMVSLPGLQPALRVYSRVPATQVGLDNAGKTTILYKLHLGEVIVSHPTVGSNVEQVKYKNITLEVTSVCWRHGPQPAARLTAACPPSQIWDLGGQQTLRPFWPTYFKSTDAIIMVVDSTDRARVGVTKARYPLGSPPYCRWHCCSCVAFGHAAS